MSRNEERKNGPDKSDRFWDGDEFKEEEEEEKKITRISLTSLLNTP